MALVKGTNCGFVLASPSADPAAVATVTSDAYLRGIVDTSAVDAAIITEVGFWCDNATEEANFEVGLYNSSGSLIYSDTVHAKGTGAGWKKATGLSWAISPSTSYRIAFQLDDTATTTNIDREASVGNSYYYQASVSTLPANLTGATLTSDFLIGIYAVYTTGSSGGFLNRNYWWFQ
jgi:hypothetical protein